MSRDMKPRQQAEPRRKGGLFAGILIGLVFGTVLAGGFAWYVSRMPMPFQDKPAEADARAPAAALQAKPSQPIPLPGKPGDKVDDKPRFEFYKILPGESGGEAAKPEAAKAEAAKPAEGARPAETPAAAKPGEQLWLQAGAFQNPAEADNLKARLALMGLEAGVQTVAMPDKGTVHRVRLGPYARPEDAAAARAQLALSGIQAAVVKGN